HLADVVGVRRAEPAALHHDRQQTFASHDPPHRLRPRPGADTPDRDRRIQWRGQDLGQVLTTAEVDVEVLALECHVTGPETADEVDALVQQLGPLGPVEHLAGPAQPGADRAEAYREDGPAAGQLLQSRRLAGTFHGRRQGRGVSMVPSSTLSVAWAMAANKDQASTP